MPIGRSDLQFFVTLCLKKRKSLHSKRFINLLYQFLVSFLNINLFNWLKSNFSSLLLGYTHRYIVYCLIKLEKHQSIYLVVCLANLQIALISFRVLRCINFTTLKRVIFHILRNKILTMKYGKQKQNFKYLAFYGNNTWITLRWRFIPLLKNLQIILCRFFIYTQMSNFAFINILAL